MRRTGLNRAQTHAGARPGEGVGTDRPGSCVGKEVARSGGDPLPVFEKVFSRDFGRPGGGWRNWFRIGS